MLPVLASLVTAATLLVSIPAEPGAVVLIEGPIIQGVAADIDGDGSREILVLSGGSADGSLTVNAWSQGSAGSWSRLPGSLSVVAAAVPATADASGAAVRLLVRRVEGADRVTLLRQAASQTLCCLTLQDVIGTEAGLRLVPVAEAATSVDAAWVVDLDGDGTDEIVATRSVAPLGDVSYPVDGFVHRWTGSAFEIVMTRLPAGSGDTPFILGDTDGRAGDELGIIATLGRPELHRISMGDDGALVMEDAGLVATDATAVPVDDGRGIAVLTSAGTLGIHRWPFGGDLGAPLAERMLMDGRLAGVIEMQGMPRLLARQPGTADRLHVLGLPNLTPPLFGAVTRTPAAAAFLSGPVSPYVGPIPRGDAAGRPAFVYSGRLLSALEPPEAIAPVPGLPMAALAGAYPIGLAGRGDASIALLHAASATGPPPDASGGRLEPTLALPAAAISVAPLSLALEPEAGAGVLEPPIRDAVPLGGGRTLAAGAAGFTATVEAPPGSRVYVAGSGPSGLGSVLSVPSGGSLAVPMPPPSVATPEPRYRATLAVSTPAGHGYLATWDVRVLTEPPRLEVSARTPLGSGTVEIAGTSMPYATVTVDGREVTVGSDGAFVARVAAPPWPTEVVIRSVDPVGNEALAALSAVGWFDYRALPWIPIAATLLAAVAVVYFLRVPRRGPVQRRADDDAALEEIEPD